jgi:ABC-type Zn uptake system ZnuABC Zn-binding protein ZnuA
MSALMSTISAWAAQPISIVAAENFYGDVAKQIGGNSVKVTSILTNPDQDPHLFEASPSVARSLAGAKIVVYNGIDYDPWMEKLLSASKSWLIPLSQVRPYLVAARSRQHDFGPRFARCASHPVAFRLPSFCDVALA